MDKNNIDLITDFIIRYYENIEKYPVKSQIKPGDIFKKLPASAPINGESYETILKDFEKIILPGITHWQSPSFHAYFPANTSEPSILAEFITAAIGVQGMKWETSPAAAELEEKVLNWLRDAMGLPENFSGVIQDTASSSTLTAILTAREKYTNGLINENGFSGDEKFRIYCSTETHSSIEKAAKISGIGKNNLMKADVMNDYSIDIIDLENKIKKDISNGYKPLCVIATIGTTGSTAVDNIKEISKLKVKYNFWLHIDAAFSGTALLLPEYRWLIEGIESADSFVFNPHKWMFTNFDCSVYFIKDKQALIDTFEVNPEYLKTGSDKSVNNYCDWGIPLGRRFRALKLWFVIRHYGLEGLKEKLRYHIKIAEDIEKEILKENDFQLLAPRLFNLLCFRYEPEFLSGNEKINELNKKLLIAINQTGKLFLSHTVLKDKYTLRMVIAQTNITKEIALRNWELIKQISRNVF